MRIKVAFLDENSNYLSRVTSVFNNKFSDKLEIYSFSEPEVAIKSLSENRINVFVASDFFDIDVSRVPKRCGFAYFVDSASVESYKGERAICRFQKAEIIYKEILGIFSESATDIKLDGEANTRVYAFASAGGGEGSSTVAAAAAKRIALMGRRVLYICFEEFGNADSFFSGEGTFGMSDVIFAIKSNKSNLALKLESYVKTDNSGVCFFSGARSALDISELNPEDIGRMISALKITGTYDNIIIDFDLNFSDISVEIFKLAEKIFLICDGGEISNQKFMNAYRAFEVLEQRKDINIVTKTALFYNKFSSKTGKAISESDIRVIGGAPRFENATVSQVTEQLSQMSVMDKIIE